MLGLVEELNEKFADLKERIEPLKAAVDNVTNSHLVNHFIIKAIFNIFS